ncbi:MAG: corrinoid protein [Spirochaetaceae bacterium]|nr:corrinoid protein [Spirochaetaceae bacterium]MDT8296965.1 corrinoid protein [Spirochaetaceae bacterium]
MEILNQISEALQKGQAPTVKELCQKALDEGLNAKEVLEGGLMDGMGIVGEKFKKNEVFVPEVLIAARAMNAGIEILKPLMVDAGVKAAGKIVIGTVKGDLHDIGKNLVKIMMEGKGFEVIDLGTDVSAEKFLETYKTENADIICCSALLTTTMIYMKDIVSAFEEDGIRDNATIMVGGAPVTQNFCDTIGADIYTSDAASAADAALQVMAG